MPMTDYAELFLSSETKEIEYIVSFYNKQTANIESLHCIILKHLKDKTFYDFCDHTIFAILLLDEIRFDKANNPLEIKISLA